VSFGLVEGTLSFRSAALGVVQSVERGFIGMAETTLSRPPPGRCRSLLGLAKPAVGEGVGDVLGNAASRWIFGAPQQLGEAAASTATSPRLPPIPQRSADDRRARASAAAGGAGALGGAAALAGGTAELGRPRAAAAFRAPRQPFAFKGGGIVPSAARGWAFAEFCRLDRGPAARPRDGVAGADQRGLAEHDCAGRIRRRHASAFSRTLRWARRSSAGSPG